jgi:hypothetical protein
MQPKLSGGIALRVGQIHPRCRNDRGCVNLRAKMQYVDPGLRPTLSVLAAVVSENLWRVSTWAADTLMRAART